MDPIKPQPGSARDPQDFVGRLDENYGETVSVVESILDQVARSTTVDF